MIKKYFLIFLITLFFILAFIHSYDVEGIEDLDYVIAIGIDQSETDENNIVLTLQIAKPKGGDNSSNSETSPETLSVECSTFDTGLSVLESSNDKNIFLSHCNAIVISEEIAKKDIEFHILNISNNVEIRPTCNLLITKDKAEDFINTISDSPNFSSGIYTQAVNSSIKNSYTSKSLLYDFYSSMRYSTKNPTAIYAGNTEANAEILGIAAFHKSDFVGILSGVEAICHNILLNELDTANILIPNPFEENKYLNLNISLAQNSSIKVQLDNQTPIINCNIDINAVISSSQTIFDDYTQEEDINKINETLQDFLKVSIENYLYKTSQEFKSDIVGFEGVLKRQYLTMDEYTAEVDWDLLYPNSEFHVTVNSEIESSYLFQKH